MAAVQGLTPGSCCLACSGAWTITRLCLYLLPDLGLAEWRVLLYVVRRTLGFKKLSDAITLDQFTEGIVTRDGAKLDGGTGLSRSNVHEGLNLLVMRNVLVRQRVRGLRTGDGISIYSLAMRDEVRRTMGSTLGMVPGPLLEATTNSALAPGGLQGDYTGVLPANYQGVPRSDYQGILPNDYQGVPQNIHPTETRRLIPSEGGPAHDYPGVLPLPYPGVPEVDNLGGDHYAERVFVLAQACGLPASDFHGAIAAAWKTTSAKLEQGALERPDAALAYFFTVLTDRVAPRLRSSPPPAMEGPILQDAHFIEQTRHRLGRVGDQESWSGILRGLAGSMTRANYTRWFARSVALDDPDSLLIVVADSLQRDWLSRHLHEVVRREALARGEQRPIRFVALEDVGSG